MYLARPNRGLSPSVVTIVYGKPKKLLAESRTMSLSLRRFVALPKIVQADYQPRSPQNKIVQITV